jgi:hypothetical protein
MPLALAVAHAQSGTSKHHPIAPSVHAVQRAASSSCPKGLLQPGSRAPEDVLRTLRAAVPRVFRVVSYGKTVKLSAKNTNVLDVRSLAGDGANLPGIRTVTGLSSYYGKLAQRRCGGRVASRSWVAIIQFPDAQAIPFSYRFAFFGRTHRGWKVWYHD